MAIYNNREVTVIGPNSMANTPETINVQHKDGTNENVSIGRVRFTEDEKKALLKAHPSKFDNVETVKDEDLKAVRLGVAPSYDPSIKEAAETEALRKKQVEEGEKQREALRKDAEAKVEKDLNKSTTPAVVGTDREGKAMTKTGNVALK